MMRSGLTTSWCQASSRIRRSPNGAVHAHPQTDRYPPGRVIGINRNDCSQPADTMTLVAAMQGRAGQMRDRGLKRIEAIVERQERVLSEGHCLFLNG